MPKAKKEEEIKEETAETTEEVNMINEPEQVDKDEVTISEDSKKNLDTEKDTKKEESPHQTSSASPYKSIRDIVDNLSKPVASRHLKRRKQGGKEITYIAWYDAVKYLDHFAPGWVYEIKSIVQLGEKLIMTVRLGILSQEGLIWREATGQEDVVKSGYGDSSSNAESMALRRAAAKFGLGRYLYEGGN